jgi:hypothetical protein
VVVLVPSMSTATSYTVLLGRPSTVLMMFHEGDGRPGVKRAAPPPLVLIQM